MTLFSSLAKTTRENIHDDCDIQNTDWFSLIYFVAFIKHTQNNIFFTFYDFMNNFGPQTFVGIFGGVICRFSGKVQLGLD